MLLRIPVKPYTLKFLHRHLSADYKLSQLDPYGIQLFAMLRRQLRDAQYDGLMSQYTSVFTVRFEPGQVFDRGCRELTSRTINDFNNWVERVFKHKFHSYVEVHSQEIGTPVFVAIRKFYAKHGLSEDDIAEETMRTSYKRYLKKQKNRQVSGNSPSALNHAA